MVIQRKGARTLLSVVGLLIILIMGGLLYTEAQAQGGIRLRLPFDGTFRLTAFVDHQSPNYTYNGNVYVYNGEERANCADENAPDSDPYCYDGHNGTDYALYREPVLAAASGRVTFRGQRSASYGNSICIDHGSGYQTWYCHLETFSVTLDSEVIAGQPIGLSGNSGTDQPYHLHFEVLHDGSVTDPFGWRGSSADPIPNGPASCLWGDGQCTAIITEDESTWYYKHPSDAGWNWNYAGNSWTLRYIPNVDTGDSTFARWRPDIPYAGPHSVFVFIPAARNKTTAAKYWVYDRDGLHFVTIDQSSYCVAAGDESGPEHACTFYPNVTSKVIPHQRRAILWWGSAVDMIIFLATNIRKPNASAKDHAFTFPIPVPAEHRATRLSVLASDYTMACPEISSPDMSWDRIPGRGC